MSADQIVYLVNSGLWSVTWLVVGYGFGRLYKRVDRIERHLNHMDSYSDETQEKR